MGKDGGIGIPTVAQQQFGLDPKALEAAMTAAFPASNGTIGQKMCVEDAIRAYLSASIPADVEGLVVALGKVNEGTIAQSPAYAAILVHEAASALRALSVRNGELERALLDFMPPYEPWMDEHDDNVLIAHYKPATFGALRRARAALAKGGNGNG